MDQSVGTWIAGTVLVVAQCIITTIIGLVIKRGWEKKNKEHEDYKRLKEEEREGRLQDAIHKEMLSLETKLTNNSNELHEELKQKLDDVQDDLVLVKGGLQKGLYVNLVHIYKSFKRTLKSRGYITVGEKKEYDSLYSTYHNLGKNGVADNMHDEVMHMPERQDGE